MLQTIKSLLLGDRSNQYKNIISFVNSFRCQESYVIEECVSSDWQEGACHERRQKLCHAKINDVPGVSSVVLNTMLLFLIFHRSFLPAPLGQHY